MSTGRSWATLAPTLVDVDPAHRAAGRATDPSGAVAVTRGWLDSRYGATLARQSFSSDPAGLAQTVVAKPTDHVFRKGHRIAVVVSTASSEWTLAKPYDGPFCGTCATWSLRLGTASGVTLPLVGAGDPKTLFAR